MKETKWLFIAISAIGGLLLSMTGLSIGWMLGTLLAAMLISFTKPNVLGKKGVPKYWLYAGQCILGIELGQKINLSVLTVFQKDWAVIIIMLLLSIVFSLLSGVVLWKFSKTDMLTSFFSTAPGGLSAMPGIAEEVGANTAVVSILQTMRVFLVIFIIPIVVSVLVFHPSAASAAQTAPSVFEWTSFGWTAVLAVTAYAGYHVGKKLKFPAPWLLGGMLSTAIVQAGTSSAVGYDMQAYWPHEIMILSQIVIAASIGSRFRKEMFYGLKQTIAIAFISTVLFISAMFVCAYIVSKATGLAFMTAALAFAPGGVAEMATTAVVLNADATFVVAVQVLRIIAVILVLPPVFRMLHAWERRKEAHSHASV
ncbi:AbrB family transcriptional regulator [Domibacillus sp. DTU_2020_1001157_1_SI_ALB_TIR_016]|uniref:AbrB family transcriptional regulator n=1 Tax=Domibacillus sp. DTU_2020_1001157_1_SI_ALB_TIR_016 TaxID=3077789 RepID=UPI0028EDA1C5|nr:AbrB family transcriptional regulator [Domibacillus sp. DTU_2020_1001157_1_SI_ALB_TIR_016]WNS80484.1 AbrB family transcriptional regulator [Domibacillus sp. DTU_2020_1001157_1_SI_ALB_TIR_016]